MSEFKTDLHALLNKYKGENDDNAADFILAKYLTGCLDVFERVITPRANWNGPMGQIGGSQGIEGAANLEMRAGKEV